ncbi:MAG: PhoH family protein [Thermodesulfobacteriota bacterium]
MSAKDIVKKQIKLLDNDLARRLFGGSGENIKRLEKKLEVSLDTRGAIVNIAGGKPNVDMAERLILELYLLLEKGYPLSSVDIDYVLRMIRTDPDVSVADVFMDTAFVSFKNRAISPKSLSQKKYLDAIRTFDIVFGVGPAGTGKTYLAMAMAVSALLGKEVERVILTRPAIEAGEKLGFLPGDLAAKIDPYLRPLYDALHDMMDYKRIEELIERGTIEVAPLAFMRGRTLNDAFVILDEAQNTTVEQIKMFLTRIGFGSKVVITGDVTQIDLPQARLSGLVESERILKGVDGIGFASFTESDVVRHPLVIEIVRAFDEREHKK